MTARWWVAFLTAWVGAVAASRVGIPAVTVGAAPTPRPLEQLGAISCCLPAAVLSILLHDPTDWLLRTSPRSTFGVRLACNAGVMCAGVGVGLLFALLFPPAVGATYVLSLFTVLVAAELICATIFGSAYAAVVPTALVALSSVAGLVPWQANIIYNPSAQSLHRIAATALCVLGIPLNAWVGDPAARRALRQQR